MKAEIIIGVHSKLVYVTAPLGTNANTMRAIARKKMNNTPCPDYVDTVTGKTRPGQWAQHLGSSAAWKDLARDAIPAKRLFWSLVVIPKWTK